MERDPSSFDQRLFRDVLGHFCTGVTVVCGGDPEAPSGLVIGSFCSVSLDPPLVLFCADHSSKSWPSIRERGVFCVNVLGVHQEDLCRRFARSGEDKFEGVSWTPAPATGAPLLDGVIAWVDCKIEDVRPYGDHDVVIGRVLALGADGGHDPLVFYKGSFWTIAE